MGEELEDRIARLEGTQELIDILQELVDRLKANNERIEALESRVQTPIKMGTR